MAESQFEVVLKPLVGEHNSAFGAVPVQHPILLAYVGCEVFQRMYGNKWRHCANVDAAASGAIAWMPAGNEIPEPFRRDIESQIKEKLVEQFGEGDVIACDPPPPLPEGVKPDLGGIVEEGTVTDEE